ncbi:hypothetical protein PAECIP111893_01936 [Paenibacillus plantiphilus]|uniref:Tn3 transposase DDE domain-containing protein n=1 Tax=Paenibacillus plantiphilus TaxID=2905650 RepID=A0ABN8G8P3_9BACL|nr:hypothetical protein PAECIP111893_01936 [Paenibacillus plantiphilus]
MLIRIDCFSRPLNSFCEAGRTTHKLGRLLDTITLLIYNRTNYFYRISCQLGVEKEQ